MRLPPVLTVVIRCRCPCVLAPDDRGAPAAAGDSGCAGNAALAWRRITGMAAHLGRTRAGRGVIAGVLTGAVAIGAGQLVAGIIRAGRSPVVVVGQLQIDYTPPWLKNFAIREFGGHDKEILVGGILVVLAVFAAVLGMLAMRRLWYGLAGLAVFALVGVFAAATRPGAAAADVLPALAAAAAGAVAMLALIRAARAAGPPEAHRGEETAGATARLPVPARPPGSPVPPRPSALPVPAVGGGGAGSSAGPQPGRRHFLVVSGAAAGTAAVAGLGGRLLAERFSVTAARASLRDRKSTRLNSSHP